MKGWKPIAAIVPGVALSFVNQWVGLFSHTPIPLPQWQQEADDTATALGVFVAVGVCMFWQDQPAPALRKRGKIFFFITLGPVFS